MTVRSRRADRVCLSRVEPTRAWTVRAGAENDPCDTLAGADEPCGRLRKTCGRLRKGTCKRSRPGVQWRRDAMETD